MYLRGLRLFPERRFLHDSIDFHLIRYNDPADAERAIDIVWEPIPERTAIPPLTPISLHEGSAQELMDGLWTAGLRPTQGRQSEGVTAAQQSHIEDLRRVAFDLLTPPEQRIALKKVGL